MATLYPPSCQPLTLNFQGGSRIFPYSLDLRLRAGQQRFFRRNFNGKVVIFGAVLEAEDRKVTSKRFATAPERLTGERCVMPPSPIAGFASRSIAGPYIHATAVNNLTRHDALSEMGLIQSGIIAAAFAAAPALAALAVPPIGAVASFLVLAAIALPARLVLSIICCVCCSCRRWSRVSRRFSSRWDSGWR
jgi:hypothetical protein